MDKIFQKGEMFRNRLEKVFRHVKRQAERQGISCYRIYDHDIPEFPFIIEMYEGKLYVSEYKRRHTLTEAEHEMWLDQCKAIMNEVTEVEVENIYLKLRKRKEGRQGQYQKQAEEKIEFVVTENGLQFIVNLSDYLDTGLFLDHRITRSMVRDMAAEKRVLNLFSYTGSFSVYAIAGGASSVISVDLSKTYLAWGNRNITLNFPNYKNHQSVHADVKTYLKQLEPSSFDIVIMDPPTFSNSQRMEDVLDIQRDHAAMINDCLDTLAPDGILFFSTNYRKFHLEKEKIRSEHVKDITRATTPFDFAGKLHRYCYRIEK